MMTPERGPEGREEDRCVVGVDFGTLSARAAAVRVVDGNILGEAVVEYEHGVMRKLPGAETELPPDWALQDPYDYLGALKRATGEALRAAGKPAAEEHYAGLLKARRLASPVVPGVKLMSYDDFFAMLEGEGAFDSFDYDDATKASILSDFAPVLKGSGDPLETHLEDILATAELKEARTYPKNEVMYVRVYVRFLTDTAEWSKPYQMLAAWDCFNNLMGYTFPVGKGRRCELPIWLEEPENKAQRDMRQRLRAARMAAPDGK